MPVAAVIRVFMALIQFQLLQATKCRQLLRLPPFPLERLEIAFLDGPPPLSNGESGVASVVDSTNLAWGANGQQPLLRDIHSCLLRLLEVIR